MFYCPLVIHTWNMYLSPCFLQVSKPTPNDGLNFPRTLEIFDTDKDFDEQLQTLQNLTLMFDVFNKAEVQEVFI